MSDELQTISRTGTPPRTRIKDATSLRSLFNKTNEADGPSAQNRASWRAMVDGEPPFDQDVLDETGQSDRSNVDLGYGRAAIASTQSSYYDLIASVPVLITPHLPHSYKTEAERAEWEPIIAAGFTRMLRRWKKFAFNFLLLSHWYCEDGIGVLYHEDDVNWQFRADSMQNVKLPRESEANEEELDFAFIKRKLRAHQLYKFIEDEEAATDIGWNVPRVRELLVDIVSQENGSKYDDWESLQASFKNNDLCCSYARAQTVDGVWGLIEEHSGKISHYLIDEAGNGESDEFMFKRPERFDSMGQAIKIFTFGVGNGTYHSIRGKGYEVYPFAGNLNELGNAIIDGAKMSTVVMLQPKDNSTRALDDLALSYYGPYGILPPGFEAITRTFPNFAQNAIPAMQLLQQQMQNNTGGYDARATTPDGQARTAFEIKAQLQKEASLSNSAVDIFYIHWGEFLNEVFRRAKRADYGPDEPGGREVAEFRRYCVERGVPVEAISRVEYVDPMRAVGMGSPAQRQLAHDEAAEFAGALDEVGRENLLRDRLADRFGYDLVDRYRPRTGALVRPVLDEKIAILENGIMRQGTPIPVSPAENHFIHAKVHTGDLLGTVNALAEQQLQPPQALQILQTELPHTEQHLTQIVNDPTHGEEIAQMRKVFQQVNAMAQRLGDSLQAQQEQQMEAQAADQQRQAEAEQARVRQLEEKAAAADTATNPKIQAMFAETQARIQTMLAESESRIRTREAEAAHQIALKEAGAATK